MKFFAFLGAVMMVGLLSQAHAQRSTAVEVSNGPSNPVAIDDGVLKTPIQCFASSLAAGDPLEDMQCRRFVGDRTLFTSPPSGFHLVVTDYLITGRVADLTSGVATVSLSVSEGGLLIDGLSISGSFPGTVPLSTGSPLFVLEDPALVGGPQTLRVGNRNASPSSLRVNAAVRGYLIASEDYGRE